MRVVQDETGRPGAERVGAAGRPQAGAGYVRFGQGAAAGLDAATLGVRATVLDGFARLGLSVPRGVTVPVGSVRALADPANAAVAVAMLDLADSGGLLRLSASAAVAVAGLPADAVCLGLSAEALDRYAGILGRRAELCAAWAGTVRLIAEHALGVPAAAAGGLILDVPDPVEQAHALVELCAAEGSGPFPSDPVEQVALAARALLARWAAPRAQRARRAQGLAADLGLALHLEREPLGGWDQLGHGTVVSRDGTTGRFAPTGCFFPGPRWHGTPRVDGRNLAELPGGAEALFAAVRALEIAEQAVVEVVFTYSAAGVCLAGMSINPRPPARAQVALSVDLAAAGASDRSRAVRAVRPEAVAELLHPRLRLTGSERLFVRGLPASPGAAHGQVVLSSERAVELAGAGVPVILVATETTPADVPGMLAARAIVTSRGGSASHAAVVARGIGRPAVCGATELSLDPALGLIRAGDHAIREGDIVSVDGWTGAVYEGHAAVSETRPTDELRTLLGWADDVRRLGVRANADTVAQTEAAIALGAEGIGLCRTEHQFLGDRLPLIQRVVLAADVDAEEQALAALADAQREDFRALFRAVGDRPVTVRLLDAPLHEFLPAHDFLAADDSRADRGALSADGGPGFTPEHAALARSLHEVNPMMGVRGVRLAVLHRGLYPAQARALFGAWVDVAAGGVRPGLEVMVPLVSTVEELRFAAGLIRREAGIVAEQTGVAVPYRLGTMVETPRAALLAGKLAAEAEFLSFGTNDLSQLTFGLSRDDVERRMMGPYLAQGLLAGNPFVELDPDGVGELISLAAARARAVRPDVKLGLCGEQGGEPRSVALCDRLGLDYVSCSPARVPIARLAAAHAVLEG
jgi:pyruvate,orthophosphate dikinase